VLTSRSKNSLSTNLLKRVLPMTFCGTDVTQRGKFGNRLLFV